MKARGGGVILMIAVALWGFGLFSKNNDFPWYYHQAEMIKARQVMHASQINFKHPLLMINATKLVHTGEGGALFSHRPEVLDAVRAAGATVVPVELVVGLGTFRPIATEVVEQHVMHAERYELTLGVLMLYLAWELTEGATTLDRDEFVEPVTLPLSRALEKIRDGFLAAAAIGLVTDAMLNVVSMLVGTSPSSSEKP